jgi:tocopherol O-methyltransferase
LAGHRSSQAVAGFATLITMIYPRFDQRHRDVAAHYDNLSQWYLEAWGEHVHHGLWETGAETTELAVVQLTQRVAREAGIAPGMSVVDIGCGYGATSRMLASGYGAKVVGYTLSSAQFDYAVARNGPGDNPQFRLQDWLENDLPDASVDVALSIESSEHMEDKPRFFAEVFRVLKPGGRFVVCAWMARDAPRLWEVKYFLEPICREGRLPSLGDELDYRSWFAGAGFTELNVQDLTRNVKRTWPIIIGRMAKRLAWDREARQFLFKGEDRVFARTVLRMAAAYSFKSLRYGLFSATKPMSMEAAANDAT